MEDLSRMYRLYHKIPKGLDPVSTIFKQVSRFLPKFIFNFLYPQGNLQMFIPLQSGTDTFDDFPVVACYC